MEQDYQSIFKEVADIKKKLRKPIKHMPKYDRYLYGDQIQELLLTIKVSVKLMCQDVPGFSYSLHSLLFDLTKLSVMLDDCIDDGTLLVKGEFTIADPRKQLTNLIDKTIAILPQDGC